MAAVHAVKGRRHTVDDQGGG